MDLSLDKKISKYKKHNEKELIKACLNNKQQAQKELYQRFSFMMKGVCLRYAVNHAEAEDILQDSFIKIFNNLKKYEAKGAFGGWIRRITVNTALEHIRKKKLDLIDNDLSEISSNYLGDDDTAIEQLEVDDLVQKIQQLAPGYRTVFNLYAIEGYTHKEIGKLLKISEGTSKSQLSRARFYLKKMIELDEIQLNKNITHVG